MHLSARLTHERVEYIMEKDLIIYNDNTGISKKMAPLLKGEKINMIVTDSRKELMSLITDEQTKLLLFDVEINGLSWYNGVEVLSEIRSRSNIPVIVVSAQGAESAKVMALNAGADDYVMVDCNPLELLARIKCQFRRYGQLVSSPKHTGHVYRVEGLEVNDLSRSVTVDGREVKLTPSEYEILKLLVQEQGRVFSISQIYEAVWHMQAYGVDNTIAVHIRHIREKIEQNPKDPHYLKVVWGTGYKVG